MYQEVEVIENTVGEGIAPSIPFTEGHIEALRSLATLLLREVEQLNELPGSRSLGNESESIDLSGEVQKFEKELIRQALRRTRGNQRNAAALLGTKITTLHAKIKKYGAENFAALSKV